jgi:hypothetical protein
LPSARRPDGGAVLVLLRQADCESSVRSDGGGKELAVKKIFLLAAVGALGLLDCPSMVLHAQPILRSEPGPALVETRTARATNSLQSGIEAHLHGEYEAAETFLRRAEAIRSDLLEPDRVRLDDYLRKNTIALNNRRQAVEHLRQAEETVRNGRPQDAEATLRLLKANKHLTAREIEQVNTLAEQAQRKPGQGWGLMRPTAPPAPPPMTPPLSEERTRAATPALTAPDAPSPEALLAEARQAFNQKNYEQAEKLAGQAELAGYRTLLPWKDSPEKLRRDLQQERSQRARELLKQAHGSIQNGDRARAQQLITDAEALKPTLMWWDEYAPDRLRAELDRAKTSPPLQARRPLERSAPDVQQAAAKPNTPRQPPPAKDTKPREVEALTQQARQLFQQGQLDQAEEVARRARTAPGIKWTLVSDTPDKVLADIGKARETQNHTRAAQLLAEARHQMEAKQLDAAEKLTYQAEGLRSKYPLWYRGERHDVLRAEIDSRRKQTSRPQLPPLADAAAQRLDGTRKPLNTEVGRRGNEPQKLVQVDARPLLPPSSRPELLPPPLMSPPVSVRPLPPQAGGAQVVQPPPPEPPPSFAGDADKERAQQLLALARAHLVRGEDREALNLVAQVQSMGLTFRDDEDSPAKVRQALVAQEAPASGRRDLVGIEAARQKALKHLAEARTYQKQGQLLNALQSTSAAQRCEAVLGPKDETPAVVLADLCKDCRGQLDACAAVAETLASHGRYQDAETYLRYSHQLALSFKEPTEAIEKQLAQVRTRAKTGAEQAAEMNPEAKLLLQSIERELHQGQTAEARRLAEALYNGPLDMRAQAVEWLTKIDEAEFRHSAKDAEVRYELGVQAFLSKDYLGAANYLNSADLRLLDQRKRAHARELLASMEMQHRARKSNPQPKETPEQHD